MDQRDIDVEGRTFKLIQYGGALKLYIKRPWPKNEDGSHTRTHFYEIVGELKHERLIMQDEAVHDLCVVAIATHRLEGGGP